MNNILVEKCLNYLKDHDHKWIIRKRKINTEFIFKSLVCSALTNIGVSSCLEGFQCNGSFLQEVQDMLLCPENQLFGI